MTTINIHEAKTHLSRIVDAIESGAEPEVILARNGRPAVRIVPLGQGRPKVVADVTKRIGIARGQFIVPANIDRDDALIEKLFSGTLD